MESIGSARILNGEEARGSLTPSTHAGRGLEMASETTRSASCRAVASPASYAMPPVGCGAGRGVPFTGELGAATHARSVLQVKGSAAPRASSDTASRASVARSALVNVDWMNALIYATLIAVTVFALRDKR